MSINRVIIVGRLTRDPDLRYTPNGHAVANFNVAVDRPFKNQNGEQDVDFINCVAWRAQAENLANYQRKGNRIGVDGRIQTRSFDGQDGKKVFVTEILAESIQFLEPRKQQEAPQHTQQSQQNQTYEQAGEELNITDDSLPF